MLCCVMGTLFAVVCVSAVSHFCLLTLTLNHLLALNRVKIKRNKKKYMAFLCVHIVRCSRERSGQNENNRTYARESSSRHTEAAIATERPTRWEWAARTIRTILYFSFFFCFHSIVHSVRTPFYKEYVWVTRT